MAAEVDSTTIPSSCHSTTNHCSVCPSALATARSWRVVPGPRVGGRARSLLHWQPDIVQAALEPKVVCPDCCYSCATIDAMTLGQRPGLLQSWLTKTTRCPCAMHPNRCVSVAVAYGQIEVRILGWAWQLQETAKSPSLRVLCKYWAKAPAAGPLGAPDQGVSRR